VTREFLHRLGIDLPIIQAPMAGVATPALAAAVSNAGALGALGLGTSTVDQARAMMHELRALTDRPILINLFCDAPPRRDPAREAAWLAFLRPQFHAFGVEPPAALANASQSFLANGEMTAMLLEERPDAVSFHFGLPEPRVLNALRNAGLVLMANATNLDEARAIEAAGLDAVIAQGVEAGGHRGMFDPGRPDERLSTFTLTRLLAREIGVPVISAGGIMDGAGIAACLALGASAAQLGTAFVACPESAASPAYREALLGPEAARTAHTAAISGRPARGIVNRFMDEVSRPDAPPIPDFPLPYDAFRALVAAAQAAGNSQYGAWWAGQGAMMARPLPAAELVATLAAEMNAARAG
jgi:nitronate monooxygenase